MMRYKRFIPALVPNGEHEAHGAALGAGKNGARAAPPSDFAVQAPLPIGLVAGAQWCRCSDFIDP